MTSSLYDSLRTTRTSRSWQVSWELLMGIPDSDPSSSSDPLFSRSLWWRPRSRPRAHQRRHLLPVWPPLWPAGASALGLGPAIPDAPLTQPHAHTPTPHQRHTPHGFVPHHQTWAHLLVNTVIHPDHYIRQRASSFLDFRYCQDDLRAQICQVCVTCVCVCVVCGVLMAAGAHSARNGV